MISTATLRTLLASGRLADTEASIVDAFHHEHSFLGDALAAIEELYAERLKRLETGSPAAEQRLVGALGFLTVLTMLVSRSHRPRDFQGQVSSVLAEPVVVNYVAGLYSIPPEHHPALQGMTFHRPGTTSWIFRSADQQTAIKLIKPWYFAIQAIRERTRSYKALVAPLFATGRPSAQFTAQVAASDELYVLMDFVEGATLDEWLARHREWLARHRNDALSYDQYSALVVAQFTDLCTALSAFAQAQVFHGDLNPRNIIVPDDGAGLRLKVVDFGPNYLVTEHVGTTNAVLALAQYVAPEVLAGSPSDHRSDWYSLGQLLLDALCPFEASKDTDVLIFHTRSVYAGIADLLDGLLAPNPDYRLVLLADDAIVSLGDPAAVYRVLARTIRNEVMVYHRATSPHRRALKGLLGVLAPADVITAILSNLQASIPAIQHEARKQASLATISGVLLVCVCIGGVIPEWAPILQLRRVLGLSTEQVLVAPRYPASAAGMTFGVVAVLYYMHIFSMQYMRDLPLRVRWFVRSQAWFFAVPILIAYAHPRLWAFCSAGGLMFMTASNWFTYQVARQGMKEYAERVVGRAAQGSQAITEALRSYRFWWLGTLCYAVPFGILGVALVPSYAFVGDYILHDRLFYVICMVFVNVWLGVYNSFVEADRVRAALGAGFYRYRAVALVGE